MQRKFNQWMSVLALTAMMSVATLAPMRANAAAGLLLSSKTTTITGGAITGLGGVTAGLGYLSTLGSGSLLSGVLASLVGGGMIAGGALFGVVGIVVLDQNQGTMSYAAVTPEQAHQLGLTDAELASYNSEVETVNAIQSQISSDFASRQPTVKDTAAEWTQYGSDLSPETRSAVVKIASHMMKSLQPAQAQ